MEDPPVERSGAGRVEIARGIAVILVAIAVGAVVVSQGIDDRGSESVAAAISSEVAGDETADDTDADDAAADSAAAGDQTDDAASDAAADDSSADETDDAMADDATDDDATSDGTSDTTDTTLAVGGTPADVSVLVLNGAGTKGIAGRGTVLLQDAGYDVLAPRNANFLGPSLVLYTEGYEDDATAIAAVFEVDPVAVVGALDPSNPPINDTRDANIVVVVGQDGLISP